MKIMAAILIVFSSLSLRGNQTLINPEACSIALEALQKVHEIKVGDSRAVVEKNFELDGGLQISSSTRYVFKKCRYFQISVEFSTTGNGGKMLPTDKITKISKVYLEYPAYD
jgi:hypothetical protein